MDTTESSAMSAKERRMRRILEEAIQRFNCELMDDKERRMLLDRIKRLRRRLGS
jgi:hypothetical protein